MKEQDKKQQICEDVQQINQGQFRQIQKNEKLKKDSIYNIEEESYSILEIQPPQRDNKKQKIIKKTEQFQQIKEKIIPQPYEMFHSELSQESQSLNNIKEKKPFLKYVAKLILQKVLQSKQICVHDIQIMSKKKQKKLDRKASKRRKYECLGVMKAFEIFQFGQNNLLSMKPQTKQRFQKIKKQGIKGFQNSQYEDSLKQKIQYLLQKIRKKQSSILNKKKQLEWLQVEKKYKSSSLQLERQRYNCQNFKNEKLLLPLTIFQCQKTQLVQKSLTQIKFYYNTKQGGDVRSYSIQKSKQQPNDEDKNQQSVKYSLELVETTPYALKGSKKKKTEVQYEHKQEEYIYV